MAEKYAEKTISLLKELVKKRKVEENDVERILGSMFRELIEEVPKK